MMASFEASRLRGPSSHLTLIKENENAVGSKGENDSNMGQLILFKFKHTHNKASITGALLLYSAIETEHIQREDV
jgi:hypothetical protein